METRPARAPGRRAYSEDDFGRFSTAELNGIDHDNTRRRD